MIEKTRVFHSKKEIMSYLGISKHLFAQYISEGMPARYRDGRWIAHVDNLEEFFKVYTRVSMKNMAGLDADDAE